MRCFVLTCLCAGASACSPSVHDMALRGELDVLRETFAAQADLVESRDRLGKTPLHYAVVSGDPGTVSLLLDLGAQADAADDTGLRPLHVAAVLDFKPIAAKLIEEGASPGSQDSFGDTPLHCAALHGSMRTLNLLLKYEDVALDAKNNEGLTPLALAKKHRQGGIVARLTIASPSL